MSIVTLDMSTYEIDYGALESCAPVEALRLHAPSVEPRLQEVVETPSARADRAIPPQLLGIDPAEFLEWVAG